MTERNIEVVVETYRNEKGTGHIMDSKKTRYARMPQAGDMTTADNEGKTKVVVQRVIPADDPRNKHGKLLVICSSKIF